MSDGDFTGRSIPTIDFLMTRLKYTTLTSEFANGLRTTPGVVITACPGLTSYQNVSYRAGIRCNLSNGQPF